MRAIAVGVACGAGRKRFAELVLALLVFLEDFAGAFDDAAGKAGETSDFNAVTFVGGAGLDAAKKNDFVGRFLDADVDVFYGGEEIGEFSELVVVGGEKRAGAGVFLKMLDDGPSDAETVEGGGATADFVEEDKACGRGVIEDAGDLRHFNEKRGTAAREIIAGADARKDAVGDRKFGLACGNKRTHLREKDDERGLAKIGGLAAHVRARDKEKLLTAGFEAEVVGNEALAFLTEKLFDDGVAAADDEEFTGGVEFGARVTAVGGKFREGSENVELRDGGGGFAKTRGLRGDAGAKIHEELALNFKNAFVGGEDFPLVLF